MAAKQRLYWIDTTKTICIICVYYAHCVAFTVKDPNIKNFVNPFYVNTFFFISGYLLYKKYLQDHIIENFTLQTYWNAIKNCICRIVVPTIIFSFIISVPKATLHDLTIDYKTFFVDILGGCSFWFTSALAIAQIAILTLFLQKKKTILFYLIITFIIFITIQTTNDFTPKPARYYFPWYYRTGLIYMFIITMGGVYQAYEKKIEHFINKGGIFLAIIVIILTYTYLYCNKDIAFIGLSGRCTTLGFWGIICSILLLIRLVKHCNIHNRITNDIGQNSIIFYFLSGAVPNTIAVLLKKIANSYTLLIFTFITSVIISYLIVLFINKYLPFLIDIRRIKEFGRNNK